MNIFLKSATDLETGQSLGLAREGDSKISCQEFPQKTSPYPVVMKGLQSCLTLETTQPQNLYEGEENQSESHDHRSNFAIFSSGKPGGMARRTR